MAVEVITQNSEAEAPAKGELVLDNTAELKKNFRQKERSRTSSAFTEALNTPQGKVFTAGIITLLSVAALFFLAIAPALGSITNQLELNQRLTEKISNMKRKQDNLSALAKKEADNSQKLTEFKELFSDDKKQSELYEDLLDATNSSNLTFRGVSFAPLEGGIGKYPDLGLSERTQLQTVRLVTEGELDKLETLIGYLETNKRVVNITDVNLSVPDVQNPSNLSIEVVMESIYWNTNI